jgi:tetratricopeptide (TPR) repeat protein
MSSDEDSIRSVTRADIESRVGARTQQGKSKNSDGRASRSNDLTHTVIGTARETRMLGGQLGSVSNKRNAIQSSKLTWWILGVFIVLIVIALIIPNPGEDLTISTTIEGKLLGVPEPGAIYRESSIDETAKTTYQPETSFVRPDDLGRAQAYAEQDRITAVIQDLFTQAREFENAGNLSISANNNATAMYQKILTLEPSNSEATQGINLVLATLLTSASDALSEDDRATAQGILQRMQSIDGKNRRTLSLENALNQYQNQQDEQATNITTLLQSADASLGEGKVISPTRDNALFYYQKVLGIDPANTSASRGIDRIITQQLELASQSILVSDLDAAANRLNTVETLSPDNPSLALLRAQISALTAMLLEAQTNSRAETTLPEVDTIQEVDASQNGDTVQNVTTTENITETEFNRTEEQIVNVEIQPENNSEITLVGTRGLDEQTRIALTLNQTVMATGLQHYYQGHYDEAYQTLKPLADRGVARAQFRLAVMQQLGRGMAKNETVAEDLYRRMLPAIRASAEAGASWAQADLASLYEDGIVVGQDIEKAFSWYLRSAEQGYSGAQTNLGTLYYYGRGVEKNREKAIEWYLLAAYQGDIVAIDNLSKLGIK